MTARNRTTNRALAWAGVIMAATVGATAHAQREGAGDARGAEAGRFSFATVRDLAHRLATGEVAATTREAPASLKSLDYDAYRSIRFERDRAIWQTDGLPFKVELFHRGYRFMDPVAIHVVEDGTARRVRFSSAMFRYDGGRPAGVDQDPDVDFAGIRVLHPLNESGRFDELITFLGASYFRFLGKNQIYGASARGAAIDIGLHRSEEFPRFTRLWIERPAADATALVVYALLESPSATGAFRFRIVPGEDTAIDVTATLHVRKAIAKLALAPITSMFLRGESGAGRDDDFRPEVHDSDGVLIRTGDAPTAWRWRPLRNPRGARTTDLGTPHGVFGLLQRDRRFDHYRDLEAHYDRRPSVLVERFTARVSAPTERTITPRVELLEFATPDETNDNIGAYVVVEPTPIPGSTIDVTYRLVSTLRDPSQDTRQRRAVAVYELLTGAKSRVLLEFTGDAPNDDSTIFTAEVNPPRGKATGLTVQPHPDRRTWRVFFDLPRGAATGTTVRLLRGDSPASELVRLP